jgi:hypothetical protein
MDHVVYVIDGDSLRAALAGYPVAPPSPPLKTGCAWSSWDIECLRRAQIQAISRWTHAIRRAKIRVRD